MSEELRKGILKPIVTGRIKFTAEEKRNHDEMCEQHLRHIGVLKDDKSIRDMKKIED